MESGQSGLLGLPVRILASPHLETLLEDTAHELALIHHQPSEGKTAKAMKMTWNCATRITLVVSYISVTISNRTEYF